MATNLPSDFLVDRENNSFRIRRDFAADLGTVWQAWTTPELLDQWWAPKPYRTQTKKMEFREGGTWLYAMVSPEGEKHWCKADFQEIKTFDRYTYTDAFCDENGLANTGKPKSHWTNVFTGTDGITTVNITLLQDSLADLEMMLEMGFREGLGMALDNLDEMLSTPLAAPAYYHGTKANLNTGDLIEAGFSSNFGKGNHAKYVYLTATLDAATWGAELAVGEGRSRIYVVEPTGEMEDDPNLTDKKFPGNPTKSYRTKHPLRVVGEVADWQGHSPEQLKAMKVHLERLNEQGIEAIED